jgi:predicted Zn-dependent protease
MRFLGFFRFCSHHNLLHTLTPVTLVAFAVFSGGAARAQQLCVVPSAHSPEGHNVFSAQQELQLGDVEAEWVEKNHQVIRDDRLAGHLNAIGSRVLSQFPANQAKIRIILIDTHKADAFSVGTERIYITRKMVSILRNDDELAGVLGHEVHHILKHDNAIAVTQMFHDILGVDAVSDRKDISDKFSRMLNSTGRDQNVFTTHYAECCGGKNSINMRLIALRSTPPQPLGSRPKLMWSFLTASRRHTDRREID